MLPLVLGAKRLSVLCLGAHSDDVEIGAGGMLLSWIAEGRQLDVRWCVLSATADRADEARKSAEDFLDGAASARIDVLHFGDGYFPAQSDKIKPWFETLKDGPVPDVILTHRRDDAHQDHRAVCQHTWNTFRDHLILEYEIPKWDGDMGQPNVYVALSSAVMARKVALLEKHFASQRSKHWFDEETFRGLARLRGMECRAPERYAEAYVGRKLILA